jgi:isopenicillin-N epimerase
MDVGKGRIAARTHELARNLKTELRRIHHVRLFTPESDYLSSGIICFDIDGLRPAETVARLREKNIVASQTPYKVTHARLAPSIINSNDDIEKVLRAIRSLA